MRSNTLVRAVAGGAAVARFVVFALVFTDVGAALLPLAGLAMLGAFALPGVAVGQ